MDCIQLMNYKLNKKIDKRFPKASRCPKISRHPLFIMEKEIEDDNVEYPINYASRIYADELNNNLTKYVKCFLQMIIKDEKYVQYPYIYFDHDHLDMEDDKLDKMIEYEYNDGPINLFYYNTEDIDNVATSYRNLIVNDTGIDLDTNNTYYIGIMGMTMVDKNDDEDNSSHYIIHIYHVTDSDQKVYIFDSGGGGELKNSIYYHMLSKMYNLDKSDMIVNKGIFETAGGKSDSVYNYIGQNIFCHTWTLWFLYQFFSEGIKMKEIDKLQGVGMYKNKDNLIKIKEFTYNRVIPIIRFRIGDCNKRFIFERYFPYIYLNNINHVQKIL